MIEDVAGAAIEVLAEVATADMPTRRERRGCWWLFAVLVVVFAIVMIVIALNQ